MRREKMSKQIIMDAIAYKRDKLGDGDAKTNILSALKWMASINGWQTQEEAIDRLPGYAAEKFAAWRAAGSGGKTGIIVVDASNPAEVLARWTHWLAADEIEAATKYQVSGLSTQSPKRGQPPKPPGEGAESHLHIRVRTADKSGWVKQAQREGVTLAQWVIARLNAGH
jgi:hypothetical protein